MWVASVLRQTVTTSGSRLIELLETTRIGRRRCIGFPTRRSSPVFFLFFTGEAGSLQQFSAVKRLSLFKRGLTQGPGGAGKTGTLTGQKPQVSFPVGSRSIQERRPQTIRGSEQRNGRTYQVRPSPVFSLFFTGKSGEPSSPVQGQFRYKTLERIHFGQVQPKSIG
jgi:hypothetical protein